MLQDYASRDALMRGLAGQVAEELVQAIGARGSAFIAVPGGTTPRPFFEALRKMDLDWAAVTICLTDERMVPESSDRSNTALVKDGLLQERAAAARFVNILDASEALTAQLPFDIVVLGMGADMHTASLFPDAPELTEALADTAPTVLKMTPPSGGEDRVTLTASVLRSARHKHILITGAEKREAYQKALAEPSEAVAPIRVVLARPTDTTVHYAE